MRGAFVSTLLDLARADERIMLLTGDLGYTVLEPFAAEFPNRFYNVGVAEQNMMGVATGLAQAGYIPFVYSIACFAVLRPFEFLRNGPVLHHLPVRIAGIGGGFEYGNNGPTHYGLEDVGVLRTQPGIQIIVPADAAQARTALQATWNTPGPVYYRLGKDDSTVVHGLHGRFRQDAIEIVREGRDVLFLPLGNMAIEALKAAEALEKVGIESTVAILACLNPAPMDDLVGLLRRFQLALAVEAHFVNGGLGSLVAEAVAEHRLGTQIVRCGVRSFPDGISGSTLYLYQKNGIDHDALARSVRATILANRPA